jgi:hypothetical protein
MFSLEKEQPVNFDVEFITHVLTTHLVECRKASSRSVQIERSTDDQVWGEPHSPKEFLTPSASLGLLSPLSSMELSAEPLSPSTLAFFKTARAQAFGVKQDPSDCEVAIPLMHRPI